MTVTDYAHRVTLHHRITGLIDQRTITVDPALTALTDTERLRELLVSLGDVARCECPVELDELLVWHAAQVVGWLEVRQGDAA